VSKAVDLRSESLDQHRSVRDDQDLISFVQLSHLGVSLRIGEIGQIWKKQLEQMQRLARLALDWEELQKLSLLHALFDTLYV
jgi:hypothetical protein